MKRLLIYRALSIAAQILFLLLQFPTVRATILYVGPNETYNNIKYAIAQASDGDTIIVRDGVYLQDIKISRSVVLISENLHGAVSGDQSDAVARFYISRDSVNHVVIDGIYFAFMKYGQHTCSRKIVVAR